MQILQREYHLSYINTRSVFTEPSFVGNNFPEITTWTKIEDQKQFCLCLESIVQIHDEWVTHVREHISFSLGVSHQVLSKDFLFRQSLHGIQFTRVFVPDQVHVTETTTTELFEWQKIGLSIVAAGIALFNAINILDLRLTVISFVGTVFLLFLKLLATSLCERCRRLLLVVVNLYLDVLLTLVAMPSAHLLLSAFYFIGDAGGLFYVGFCGVS